MLTANHKQVLYVKIIKSKDLLRRVNLKKAWTQQMYENLEWWHLHDSHSEEFKRAISNLVRGN